MPTDNNSASPASPAIDEALAKARKVTEEVKGAADDLLVVHAVLDKEIPSGARTEPVNEAVAQASQVEKRLSKSAEVLEDATRALENETGASNRKKLKVKRFGESDN